MCSVSAADSYLRRIDFVYHSTLGWRVRKKKEKKKNAPGFWGKRAWILGLGCRVALVIL